MLLVFCVTGGYRPGGKPIWAGKALGFVNSAGSQCSLMPSLSVSSGKPSHGLFYRTDCCDLGGNDTC